MKLYKRLAVILAACVLTIGISSTWAYYSDTQSVDFIRQTALLT